MIQRAHIASLSKLAEHGGDMVGSMTLLDYGDQESSTEISIGSTGTVPTCKPLLIGAVGRERDLEPAKFQSS